MIKAKNKNSRKKFKQWRLENEVEAAALNQNKKRLNDKSAMTFKIRVGNLDTEKNYSSPFGIILSFLSYSLLQKDCKQIRNLL